MLTKDQIASVLAVECVAAAENGKNYLLWPTDFARFVAEGIEEAFRGRGDRPVRFFFLGDVQDLDAVRDEVVRLKQSLN